MYCRYCGQQIDDKSQYCSYCGKYIGEKNGIHLKQGVGKYKRRKRPHKNWTQFGLLVLCMFAVTILLFVLHDKKRGNDHVEIRTSDELYTPDDDAIETDEETGITFVNNMVIVFFQTNTSSELIDSTIKSIDGEIVGKLDFIDQYQVRVPTHSLKELTEICEDLKKQKHVLFASYDEAFMLEASAIPNDPWAGHWWNPQKWSQENPDDANWWLEAIDAPDAWDYNSHFSKITIGIVDNGFDTGHEDLKDVIKSVSLNNDSQIHGTHVAGIIGAKANNHKGITGIVWNCDIITSDWQIETNPLQWFADFIDGQKWNTTTQILGGTAILIKEGAKIVNISAGQTHDMEGTTRDKKSIDKELPV